MHNDKEPKSKHASFWECTPIGEVVTTLTTSVLGAMRPFGVLISMTVRTSAPLFSTPAFQTEAHNTATGDVYLGLDQTLPIGNTLSNAHLC